MDDWNLLEQFRRATPDASSGPAFAELVRRHAGFVLATCRRRLRDAHLSEDAAQAVFLVLARRPPARSTANASLAGWLYKTAIYACNNAMQARRSRQLHERRAAAETVAAAKSDRSRGLASVPSDAEVLLDQALANLSSKERDAVFLRYYQDQSVQQVGAALGISQNSATKRITRALERMREFLADQGLAISAPALIDAVTSATCAPVASSEFIAQAVTIGTGEAVASSIVQQLAEGVNLMFRFAKLKLVAAVVICVVTAGGGIVAMNQLMAQDTKPPAKSPVQPAQPGKPATQPADTFAPDTDPSTPKGALRAFAQATRAADYETLARVSKTDADNELEGTLIAASNNYQKAMGDLFSAVREKFGDTEVRKFMRQRGAVPLEPFLRLIDAELDHHDVVVQGETATLVDRRDPKTETNINLVRDGGVWKVVSTGLVAQFGNEQASQRVEMMTMRAEIVCGVAAEVAAGKYENIEAVGNGLRDALRRR